MTQYKLTYFDVRGLGEHIRFLFIAAGVSFEDFRISTDGIWPEWKPKIKYGQLPVLEVDGKELSQSLAIGRFLGKKFNFECRDEFLSAKADEMVEFASELRLHFRPYLLNSDENEKSRLKEILVKETMPKYYGILESIGSPIPGDFITGSQVCWQDFFIANWIEIYGDVLLGEDFVDKYPKLKKIKESVFAIPAVKAYLSTRKKTFV